MKLVAPAFRHDAHLPARAAPEFRRGHARLHRELLHRIGDPEVPQRCIDLCHVFRRDRAFGASPAQSDCGAARLIVQPVPQPLAGVEDE